MFDVTEKELIPFAENKMRLALQSLYVVGTWQNDDNFELRQIPFTSDEGFLSILAGKDFLLLISASGKVSIFKKARRC